MAALASLFAAGLLAGIERQREERAAFMEECVRYRPRFECTALWRAGNRDDPAIIPLPIPIPTPGR